MVEAFKVHNLIVVTVLAIVGFLLVKTGLRHFGHADLADMF